jgi:hypothetical protein
MKPSYHDPNYRSPAASSPILKLMHQCWSAECYVTWETLVDQLQQDEQANSALDRNHRPRIVGA